MDTNGDGGHGVESESSLDEIEDTLALVSKEINRRLSAGRVRDIADGTLFRYHQDLTKWAERHKKEEESAQVAFNLLDQIDFLPTARATELLEEEIKIKEKELKLHRKKLKELAEQAQS